MEHSTSSEANNCSAGKETSHLFIHNEVSLSCSQPRHWTIL